MSAHRAIAAWLWRSGAVLAVGASVAAGAQAPSPPLPPNVNLPALSPAPTQRNVPAGPNPQAAPNAQMQPPPISPLSQHVDTPNAPSPQITAAANGTVQPSREEVHGLTPNFLGFLGPYREPVVPPLFNGDQTRLQSLIRDGKLYLTLQDAIALALENNLDVETERYNLVAARTDEVRAKGGGNLRGIDYTVNEPPNGVGGPGSPLLASETTNTNPTTPTVTDLTSLNSTTQTTQSLSQLSTGFQYATGPNIPIFDPQLIGDAGWLRRSDTVNLTSVTGTTAGTGSGESNVVGPALNFTALNLAYVEGFSTGAQLTAIVNNDSEVLYGSTSKYDPFFSPSTSLTLTQPLLRGRGRDVNLRFLRIARTDQKISRLLFEQQVLDTIYGVSRLYFDLVSLGENVLVQQESLRAATKLRQDDENQVQLGTLAPIELTRAQALESSSRFSLIQAQGLYKQEEIILKNQLLRTASPVFTAQFDEIVPMDRIVVPDHPAEINVADLVREGLAQRPDLAQAKLQIETGKISAAASRNAAAPQLNLYGNVEVRGTTEQPYETLGSIGTGQPTAPAELAAGGLRTSTIYQAGVQLTLPLRNRVAESDAARDVVQLREVEGRTEKLSQQIREQVETAVVALQTAQAAYVAATESRQYQSQLLDAERDKLSVGQSTDLAVLQDEAYLAQAKSTEIAARSNWKKAEIELDHDLGDLLEKNHIVLDDAIRGTLPQ
jgi:outer membrane protein TolC